MTYEKLCKLCKKYRQQKNVTVDLLSRSTGISAVALYKFEHGDRKSIKTFLSYLNFFGKDIVHFIFDKWEM